MYVSWFSCAYMAGTSILDKENYLYTTVKQVISDLNFENKRAGKKGATSDRLGRTFCKVARDLPELTAAAKSLRDEPDDAAGGANGYYWVWNHVTGRRRRTRWKVVDPNAPLPAVQATRARNGLGNIGVRLGLMSGHSLNSKICRARRSVDS